MQTLSHECLSRLPKRGEPLPRAAQAGLDASGSVSRKLADFGAVASSVLNAPLEARREYVQCLATHVGLVLEAASQRQPGDNGGGLVFSRNVERLLEAASAAVGNPVAFCLLLPGVIQHLCGPGLPHGAADAARKAACRLLRAACERELRGDDPQSTALRGAAQRAHNVAVLLAVLCLDCHAGGLRWGSTLGDSLALVQELLEAAFGGAAPAGNTSDDPDAAAAAHVVSAASEFAEALADALAAGAPAAAEAPARDFVYAPDQMRAFTRAVEYVLKQVRAAEKRASSSASVGAAASMTRRKIGAVLDRVAAASKVSAAVYAVHGAPAPATAGSNDMCSGSLNKLKALLGQTAWEQQSHDYLLASLPPMLREGGVAHGVLHQFGRESGVEAADGAAQASPYVECVASHLTETIGVALTPRANLRGFGVVGALLEAASAAVGNPVAFCLLLPPVLNYLWARGWGGARQAGKRAACRLLHAACDPGQQHAAGSLRSSLQQLAAARLPHNAATLLAVLCLECDAKGLQRGQSLGGALALAQELVEAAIRAPRAPARAGDRADRCLAAAAVFADALCAVVDRYQGHGEGERYSFDPDQHQLRAFVAAIRHAVAQVRACGGSSPERAERQRAVLQKVLHVLSFLQDALALVGSTARVTGELHKLRAAVEEGIAKPGAVAAAHGGGGDDGGGADSHPRAARSGRTSSRGAGGRSHSSSSSRGGGSRRRTRSSAEAAEARQGGECRDEDRWRALLLDAQQRRADIVRLAQIWYKARPSGGWVGWAPAAADRQWAASQEGSLAQGAVDAAVQAALAAAGPCAAWLFRSLARELLSPPLPVAAAAAVFDFLAQKVVEKAGNDDRACVGYVRLVPAALRDALQLARGGDAASAEEARQLLLDSQKQRLQTSAITWLDRGMRHAADLAALAALLCLDLGHDGGDGLVLATDALVRQVAGLGSSHLKEFGQALRAAALKSLATRRHLRMAPLASAQTSRLARVAQAALDAGKRIWGSDGEAAGARPAREGIKFIFDALRTALKATLKAALDDVDAQDARVQGASPSQAPDTLETRHELLRQAHAALNEQTTTLARWISTTSRR
jgi:hypothetical protein